MAQARKPAARVIDLDKQRAARAETAGDPVEIRQGGEKFTLPAEMPVDFAIRAQQSDLRGAVAALFGDDADRFLATRPSIRDLEALIAGANEMYGVGPGEAPASSGS